VWHDDKSPLLRCRRKRNINDQPDESGIQCWWKQEENNTMLFSTYVRHHNTHKQRTIDVFAATRCINFKLMCAICANVALQFYIRATMQKPMSTARAPHIGAPPMAVERAAI
jgi:hypothetical protein